MSNLQANKASIMKDQPGSSKSLLMKVARRIFPQTIKDRIYRSLAILKKIQRRMIFILSLLSNYTYDCKRFVNYSSSNGNINTKTQLIALITMDYHRIEKGLALREPRVGFGTKVVQKLLTNLSKYQEQYGSDEIFNIALNTLFAYYHFNLEHGIDNESLHKTLLTLSSENELAKSTSQGGVIDITKQSILAATPPNPKLFFHSRYSIRQFSKDEVDVSLIEQAVEIAQKTPSVCNRQSSKVYMFSKAEDKKKVLSFQNGNRGFGDQASKILIVVSDLQYFTKIGERNQSWVDGGMYAMSIVYALHALGLGTCCLNWSVENSIDQALKTATGIQDHESVIMMIAVGHLPDELKVAQSPRKDVNKVLVSM